GHGYTKQGSRRYRYYTCQRAMKRGRADCPTKSIPAPEIEKFVVGKIRSIKRDPHFTPELPPREQRRIIQHLVERVAYDGTEETVSITFRSGGSKAQSEEGVI
ncbi:zinc ribbon domain-containing protein, partial [Candidatus Eisenbacteria bacterium]